MIVKVSLVQPTLGLNNGSIVRERIIALNFGSQIIIGGSQQPPSEGGGDGTEVSVLWADILNKPTFSAVATSGSFNDLSNSPVDSGGYVAKAQKIKDVNGSSQDKKIWTGTQSEYDAISTYDAQTLYFVL